MIVPTNRFVFFLLLLATGCATTAPNDRPVSNSIRSNQTERSSAAKPVYVTVPVDTISDGTADPEEVEWLRRNDVRVEKDANGDIRVFDSPACRRVLVQYRRVSRLRMDICACNIANINTTHDATGPFSPYRRKIVLVDKSGAVSVIVDPSPFLKRFEPGNPDADAHGFVSYPNIDRAIEIVNAHQASIAYRMAMRMLMFFDPTLIDFRDDSAIVNLP